MSDNERIEERARPAFVIGAWVIALPIGAITALYHGHVVIGAFLTLNAIALGWCDI